MKKFAIMQIVIFLITLISCFNALSVSAEEPIECDPIENRPECLEGENSLGCDLPSYYLVTHLGYSSIWDGTEVSFSSLPFVHQGITYYCLPICVMHCPPSLVTSFLDKENLSREVTGAAADGVSKVIIQITGLEDNVDKKDINITIPEQDGHLEDDKKISDGVFTQTYVAPDYFVREGYPEDLLEGKREIDLTITVNEQEIKHPQFFLTKTPVVLLHGLWDNARTWDTLKLKLEKDHGYQHIVAFSYTNFASFDVLNWVIDKSIDLSLGQATTDNIVVKKVDVVAHSMGGVITKLYGKESNIKSITTVGTPHFGSPLADILWPLVDDADDDLFEAFIADLFLLSGHPVTYGAIEDLRTTTLHVEANSINVPIYVLAGISPLTNQTTIAFVNLLSSVFKVYGLLPMASGILDLNQLIFEGKRNDWIVSESSQKGGTVGDEDYVTWHLGETRDEDVLTKMIDFLHRTESTASDYEASLIKSQEDEVVQKRLSNKLLTSRLGVSSGSVEITSPIEGQEFQPGDIVDVTVDASDNVTMVILATSTGESTLLYNAPFSFQFTITDDFVGALDIIVGARDDTGFIGSDDITINVSTTATLTDIKLYPEIDPLYLSVGATVPLAVYGVYDDSVTREITSSGSGTSYISSNSDIMHVSSDGLITVKSQGEATVTVENSEIRNEITVIGESVDPVPEIKANGSDGHVEIIQSDNLSLTVELDSGDFTGEDADWWVAESAPDGWYYYSLSTSWTFAGSSYTGLLPTYQGALFDLNTYEVLNKSGLSEGTHTFYFAIDTNMNGSLDMGSIYYDSVEVNVTVTKSPPSPPPPCSDYAGNWSGTYSEKDCDNENYTGTWTGVFASDCSVTLYDDDGGKYEGTITGNNVTASGYYPDCGTVRFDATISGNRVTGTFTYSLGGGGSFDGSKN